MNVIPRLIVTFNLIIFMIGGGRLCGCELLEFAGAVHGDHHISDSCGHNQCSSHDSGRDLPDNHEDSPDCCEFLTPIEGDLPKSLALPDLKPNGESSPLLVDQSLFNLPVGRWNLGPPDDWVDSRFSLASLQRFLV